MGFYKPETIECNGEQFRVYLTEEKIQKRVQEIAEDLNQRFEGEAPIFVGVLNGAFYFVSDLMRYMKIPCEVDFLKLTSYGDTQTSTVQLTELKELDADIRGRHVILVEDIIDTGLSIKYLSEKLNRIGPASLTTIALLHKPEKTIYEMDVDYIGFEIPSCFMIGYGLDFAQKGRNYTQIYRPLEES